MINQVNQVNQVSYQEQDKDMISLKTSLTLLNKCPELVVNTKFR